MTAIRRRRDPSVDVRSDPVPASAAEELARQYGYGHWRLFAIAADERRETIPWGPMERAAAEHLWRTWERHLGVDRPSSSSVARLMALNGALYGAMQATLDPTRLEAYGAAIDQVETDTASWEIVIGRVAAAYWRHAALLWLAITHLTKAGLDPDAIWHWIERLGAIDVEPERQAPPVRRRADLKVIADRTRAAIEPVVQRAREAWPGIAAKSQQLAVATGRGLAEGYAKARKIAAKHAATAERRRQETSAARQRAREKARADHEARLAAAAAAPLVKLDASIGDPVPATSSPALPLDGRRLHTSGIGTWLMLVVLSWVSLVWGAIITAPFGVGIAVIASFMGGVIAVPLWGTVFGLLGMGAARSSTLAQMRFEQLPASHPIAGTCARYCAALGIPMPQLGTIPDTNAFAMGTSHRDATVALGRPLLDRLSTAEVNAILAHELGHVVSGDMRKMMLMRTFQNATVWFMMFQGLKQFARWIICWAAELAILAFSRHREYWADAIGAALAGKEAMIGALRALDRDAYMSSGERRHARFMFRAPGLSTHPTMAQRIRALEQETYMRRLPMRPSP